MAGGQQDPEASPVRYQRHRAEIDDECAEVLGIDVRGPDADPFDIPAKRAPVERLRRWRAALLFKEAGEMQNGDRELPAIQK
nr:unnamed protein product [Digitaria exilis]